MAENFVSSKNEPNSQDVAITLKKLHFTILLYNIQLYRFIDPFCIIDILSHRILHCMLQN